MPGAITDLISRVTDSTTGRPVIAQLASPGKALAASSININDATNWTTTTAIHFSIFSTTTIGGMQVKDPTTQTDWKGVLAGTTITGLVLTGGSDRAYSAGALVEITPTARYAKDMYEAISAHTNQDGTLKTSAVQAALNIGTTNPDWTPLATLPSTITNNGNRSYTIIIPGVDYTDRLMPGTRLRNTRTVAAPTQSSSLNGTSQYYVKTSPAGMTFVDDFAGGIWVKLNAYPVGNPAPLMGRYNNSNGWYMRVETTGQIMLIGHNGGPSNFSYVQSYQSIPLNRWVHIAAQLDMSAFTATTTTSYIMIDGADTASIVARSGTNPTALVQAGDLNIGTANGGSGFSFLNGKIAQAWVASAKVTQANVRNLMSQGLTSSLITSNSIISAYSFDNNINDLNTTNANNLTAVSSATATNADSPFGIQGNGNTSSTLEYAIVQRATFSTDTTLTIQVPEGGALPTSGGISSWSYTGVRAPYGFPAQKRKWRIETISTNSSTTNSPTQNVYYNAPNLTTLLPLGDWDVSYNIESLGQASGAGIAATVIVGLSTTSAAADSLAVAFESMAQVFSNATGNTIATMLSRNGSISVSTQTPIYVNYRTSKTSMGLIGVYTGDGGNNSVYFDNSLL